MGDLTLTIDMNGTLTKSEDPWLVGEPQAFVHARLVNKSAIRHKVEFTRFEHVATGHPLKPVAGRLFWEADGGHITPWTRHRVHDHGSPHYGSFTYVTEVDGVPGPDPEIVVDPPPGLILKGSVTKGSVAVGAAIGGLIGLVGGALIAQADAAPPVVRQQRVVTAMLFGGVCAAIGAWLAGARERR